MKTLFAVVLFPLCLVVGCDDDTSGPPPPAADLSVVDLATPAIVHDLAKPTVADASMTAAVDVMDNFYSPQTVTIAVGGTVTWTWRGANSHTVSSNDTTSFDSSPAKSSGTFAHTFPAAGSFPYHCMVHGLAMSGTVTVQ